MSRLLRSNFSRLIQNKIFWVCNIGLLLFGMVAFWGNNGLGNGADTFFAGFMMILIVFGAFCSLFLGTDYSDGTIRNKLIVGNKRAAVYMSNLLTCIAADIFIIIVFGVTVRLMCLVTGTRFEIEMKPFIILCIVLIAVTVSTSSLLVLFGMLNQNKAVVAVVSLIVIFGGLLFSTYTFTRLTAEEYIDTYEAFQGDDENQAQTSIKTIKNPSYLEAEKRKYYQLLMDVQPFGQAIEISMGGVNEPEMLVLYSVITTFASSAAGIFFFKRKNIK